MRNLLVSLLIIISQQTFAISADDSTFVCAERQIAQVSQELADSRFKDHLQDSLGNTLVDMFRKILEREGSFDYPFDSIRKNISHVKSADGRLRIFTWFTVGDAGNYRYYGFMQYDDKYSRNYSLFELKDNDETVDDWQYKTYTPQNWSGAVYYAIVEQKGSSGTIYTLLGWDGCGLYTTKKVIEPLFFQDAQTPKFGKPIIKIGRSMYNRLVFEYNKRATMMINYDTNLDVIVMDHLAVFSEQDTSNPMFFGPDMSYDALKFEDGMWLYQPNIEYMRPKAKKR